MNRQTEFYVNCRAGYQKKSGYIKTFSDKNGNTFSIGFTKIPYINLWRATELQTGLRCSKNDHKTLKACISDVESSLHLFEGEIKKQLSFEPVLRFRNFIDIKNQFDNKENISAFGELQAYVELPNSCKLKVTHETDGLEKGDWKYWWEISDSDGKILDSFYTENLSEETCYDQLEGIYDFVAKHRRRK